MDKDSSPTPSRAAFWWTMAPPTILALYVLSIGPATFIYHHIPSSTMQKAIETVYAPLLWFFMSPAGKPMQKVFEWYIALWI